MHTEWIRFLCYTSSVSPHTLVALSLSGLSRCCSRCLSRPLVPTRLRRAQVYLLPWSLKPRFPLNTFLLQLLLSSNVLWPNDKLEFRVLLHWIMWLVLSMTETPDKRSNSTEPPWLCLRSATAAAALEVWYCLQYCQILSGTMILYFFPAFIRHVSVISAAFLLLIVNTYSRITESLTAHPQLKTLFQTRKMASPVERLVKQQNGEVPCKGKKNLASIPRQQG